MPESYSLSQLAAHKSEGDIWIAVHGKVYNVSSFLDEHPGGMDTLLDVAGRDATEEFEDTGHSANARSQLKSFYVGELKK